MHGSYRLSLFQHRLRLWLWCQVAGPSVLVSFVQFVLCLDDQQDLRDARQLSLVDLGVELSWHSPCTGFQPHKNLAFDLNELDQEMFEGRSMVRGQ